MKESVQFRLHKGGRHILSQTKGCGRSGTDLRGPTSDRTTSPPEDRSRGPRRVPSTS